MNNLSASVLSAEEGKAKYDQAFGIAVVLLVIVLGINLLARFVTKKFGTKK